MRNGTHLKIVLLALLIVTCSALFGQSKVFADSYCGLLPAVPQAYLSNPPQNSDCLKDWPASQSPYTALSKLTTFSSSTSNYQAVIKNKFITDMVAFENGQNLQRIGASYIESKISGSSGLSWSTRLNLDDISLSIALFSYTSNSGYDVTTNAFGILPLDNPGHAGTASALIFKTPDGITRLVLKIDCGNILNEMPNIPSPPVIYASKVNEKGEENKGYYSSDNISATQGVNSSITSDTSSPSVLNVQNGIATVTAANSASGWTVSGYYTFTCVRATPPSTCSDSSSFVSLKAPPYTYTFPVKTDYTYFIKWVYKVQTPNVIVKKVSSDGTTGTFTSDIINVDISSQSNSSSSTGNPSSFMVPIGTTATIYAQNSVSGWSVTGYTWCDDSNTVGCDGNILPNKYAPNFSSSLSITPVVGHKYYVDVVYVPLIPPLSNCSGLQNASVSVKLSPDTSKDNTLPNPLSTSTQGGTLTHYVHQSGITVTGINDISFGDNHGKSLFSFPTDLLSNPTASPAIINYQPFINNFAYDSNQAQVVFTSKYTVTLFTALTNVGYYLCSDGSTKLAANTCPNTTTSYPVAYKLTPTTTCSKGTWNGTDCGSYTSNPSCPNNYTLTYKPPTYSQPKNCQPNAYPYYPPVAYSPGGVSIKYPVVTTVTYPTSCRSSTDIGPDSNHMCTPASYSSSTNTGSGTAMYYYGSPKNQTDLKVTNYTPTTPPSNFTPTAANDTSTMKACYQRPFSVTSVNAASASVSLLNNSESPTYASASGFTASVKFTFPDGQLLREPMIVPLTYHYNFSKVSSTGASTAIASCNGNSTYTISAGTGPFSSTASQSHSLPALVNCTASVNSANPILSPGDVVCATVTVSPTGNFTDSYGNLSPSGGNSISMTSVQRCSGPVVNEPYFKVFGGDISVGNGFGNSCPSNNNSGIFGWTTGTTAPYPQYVGAGAQYLVISPSGQNSVYSNQNNPNGTSSSPQALSLTSYTVSCMPDYLSNSSAATSSIPQSNLSHIKTGSYTMASGSTISKSTISNSQHIVIYVKGDLNISGDITFPDSYSSVGEIPSLIVIVGGNIYIDPSVQNLSGIFIAQSSQAGEGYIYDCASKSTPVGTDQLYATCINQLTVNGSFVANKVVLNRTNSSLRSSSNTETNTRTNASEIFNNSPAFWMSTSLPQSINSSTSAGYDSLINLPPVL